MSGSISVENTNTVCAGEATNHARIAAKATKIHVVNARLSPAVTKFASVVSRITDVVARATRGWTEVTVHTTEATVGPVRGSMARA